MGRGPAPAGPGAPTLAEWRALYAAAAEYREAAPWRSFADTDVFGVRDPETGRIAWCSVFGAAGEILGLLAYAGSEGLAVHQRMAAGDVGPDEAPFVQDGWLASFEDRGALDAADLATIRTLGLRFRGARNWPRFRSYRPGFLPWHLAAVEARGLATVLRQAVDVARRFAGSADRLAPDAEGRWLVREPVPGPEGGAWEDRRLVPPPPEPPAPVADVVDVSRLRRLRDGLRASPAIWACDHFQTPAAITGEGDRPFFATAALVVDHGTGMILGVEMGAPPLDRETVRSAVLAAMERLGERPAGILAASDLARAALAPVASVLGLTVTGGRQSPALEAARRALLAGVGRL